MTDFLHIILAPYLHRQVPKKIVISGKQTARRHVWKDVWKSQ